MRRLVAATAVVATTVAGGGVAWGLSNGADRPVLATQAAPTSSTTVPASPKQGHGPARADRLQKVLDALVEKGTITRAQADAVLAEWKAQEPSGGDHGRPGFAMGFGVLRDTLSTAAKAIGISADQLRTEMRQGTSIADVAKAHGVDPAKVTDALTAEANRLLDKAVADGKLSAEQATKVRARLADMVEMAVNGSPGRGHGPRFGRHAGTPGGPFEGELPAAPDSGSSQPPQGVVPPSTVAPSTAAPTTVPPSTTAPSTTDAPSATSPVAPATT